MYDNEDLPEPSIIQSEHLSEGVEIVDIETTLNLYFDEIMENLKGRHWHISYYVKSFDEIIEAIGYKNDQGEWDIFFEDYTEEEETYFFDSSYKKNSEWPYDYILFSVHSRSEAQNKFNQFVENVILKHRKGD